MPSTNHAIVQTNLVGEWLRQRDFRTLAELTLDIDGDRFTPDISVYPRSLPIDFTRDVVRRTDPPLAVVEIFSPQQGTQDVLDKLPVYFAHGVKSVWIVSPPLHHIEIHTAAGEVRRYLEGVATDPATGLTADLAAVFS